MDDLQFFQLITMKLIQNSIELTQSQIQYNFFLICEKTKMWVNHF